jgi:hypothetical protein
MDYVLWYMLASSWKELKTAVAVKIQQLCPGYTEFKPQLLIRDI